MSTLATSSGFTSQSGATERERFISIVNRALAGGCEDRRVAKPNLAEFIKFSPQSDRLIDSLIKTCVNHDSSHRLDFAIDILEIVDNTFQSFASSHLEQEITLSSGPNGLWHPNYDYWYVLLRSLAKCSDKHLSLLIISACQDEPELEIGEAVVEALADLQTQAAKSLLLLISVSHANNSVRVIADEYLSDCS